MRKAQGITAVLHLASWFLLFSQAPGQENWEMAAPSESADELLETSIAQTDWETVALALRNGGIPLGYERREEAIRYCASETVKLDRTLILDCVFQTTRRVGPLGYGTNSPESISHLLGIGINKAIHVEARHLAFYILALNLDNTKEGAKLEELLWSHYEDVLDEQGKSAFVKSLSFASWTDQKQRLRRIKEVFRTPEVSDDLRLGAIASIGLSVGERRCDLLEGLDAYSFFLNSKELKEEHRKQIAEFMDIWVMMYRTVQQMKQFEKRTAVPPEKSIRDDK